MKASWLLRIAAVIAFLYFAGHTAGMPWTPAVGPAQMPVLEAMKSRAFNVEGFTRTYWDFYFGFGVIISVYVLALAVVLWQLGSLAQTHAVRIRPIIASIFAAFVVNAVLAWKYFFIVPVVVTVAISVCLALAFVMAGRSNTAEPGAPADRPQDTAAGH